MNQNQPTPAEIATNDSETLARHYPDADDLARATISEYYLDEVAAELLVLATDYPSEARALADVLTEHGYADDVQSIDAMDTAERDLRDATAVSLGIAVQRLDAVETEEGSGEYRYHAIEIHADVIVDVSDMEIFGRSIEGGRDDYSLWCSETDFETVTDVVTGGKPMSDTHDFHDGRGSVPAKQHPNGRGWVASTAIVYNSVYIGPNARVYGNARVSDSVVVSDSAVVSGNAVVGGNVRVYGNARVSDSVVVSGNARVYGDARVHSKAVVSALAAAAPDLLAALVEAEKWMPQEGTTGYPGAFAARDQARAAIARAKGTDEECSPDAAITEEATR